MISPPRGGYQVICRQTNFPFANPAKDMHGFMLGKFSRHADMHAFANSDFSIVILAGCVAGYCGGFQTFDVRTIANV